jgi:DNA repair protein RecO (recombination protein O)
MPFTHYRTEGIFLKKENRGEADQLFTVFTKEFGKVEILGKAIRKITSKLRAGADIFYLSEIEFIQGKTYKILTDAVLKEKFNNLRQNPGKLELAYNVVDDLDSLTYQEEKDKSIWRLLKETFEELNVLELSDKNILKMVYFYFLWRLFLILGYKPELYNCPICQKKLLPETFWFLPTEGGVVCWQCLKGLSEEKKKLAEDISVDTVKIIRVLLEKDLKQAEKIKIDSKEMDNLEKISQSFLSFLKGELSKKEI